jgi:8-oxo-dGTP pyrophosphatase MutT (NUDIX family)
MIVRLLPRRWTTTARAASTAEMADISFRLGGHRINLRVGGVFVADGCVLLNRLERDDYWFLPGGRIAAGESTDAAILREIREEIGITCRIVRPLFLLENFFALHGEPFHELGLYYLLDPIGAPMPQNGDRVATDEDLAFRWHPVARLGEIDFRPAVLAPRLTSLPASLEHIVSRD